MLVFLTLLKACSADNTSVLQRKRARLGDISTPDELSCRQARRDGLGPLLFFSFDRLFTRSELWLHIRPTGGALALRQPGTSLAASDDGIYRQKPT